MTAKAFDFPSYLEQPMFCDNIVEMLRDMHSDWEAQHRRSNRIHVHDILEKTDELSRSPNCIKCQGRNRLRNCNESPMDIRHHNLLLLPELHGSLLDQLRYIKVQAHNGSEVETFAFLDLGSNHTSTDRSLYNQLNIFLQ